MAEERKPWAFIAHKDGYWAGLAMASLSRKSLTKFLGEFATDGFTITTVHDRGEFDAFMAPLKAWRTRRQLETERVGQAELVL